MDDYIFISYSRRQLYFAESVVQELQRDHRLRVWFDLQQLTPGSDWQTSLKHGYENCRYLILVASNASLKSKYVEIEWRSALERGCPVYVIIYEPVVLPQALVDCPTYDFRRNFPKKLNALKNALLGNLDAHYDPAPKPNILRLRLIIPTDIWLLLGALFILSIAFPPMFVLLILFWYQQLPYSLLRRISNFVYLFGRVIGTFAIGMCIYTVISGSTYMVFQAIIAGIVSITIYIIHHQLVHSRDIKHWFATGRLPEDRRRGEQHIPNIGLIGAINNTFYHPKVKQTLPPTYVPAIRSSQAEEKIDRKRQTYRILSAPADYNLAIELDDLMLRHFRKVDENGTPEIEIIILSTFTSYEMLVRVMDEEIPIRVLILASAVKFDPNYQQLSQIQIVDFRDREPQKLSSLVSILTNQTHIDGRLAQLTTPSPMNKPLTPQNIQILAIVVRLYSAIFLGRGIAAAMSGILVIGFAWAVLSIMGVYLVNTIIQRRLKLSDFSVVAFSVMFSDILFLFVMNIGSASNILRGQVIFQIAINIVVLLLMVKYGRPTAKLWFPSETNIVYSGPLVENYVILQALLITISFIILFLLIVPSSIILF